MSRLSVEEAALREPLTRSLRQLRDEWGRFNEDLQLATGYSLTTTIEDVFSVQRRVSKRAVTAVAAALGADPDEWGRRYEELGLERHRARHLAVRGRGLPQRRPQESVL